jgi:succinyl-CoA synthetase beta subunit
MKHKLYQVIKTRTYTYFKRDIFGGHKQGLLQNVFHLIFGGETFNNIMLDIFGTNKKVDYIMINLVWI